MTSSSRVTTFKAISLAMFATGLLLMAGKIHFDSEPGALPLALVVVGVVGFVIAQVRGRPMR